MLSPSRQAPENRTSAQTVGRQFLTTLWGTFWIFSSTVLVVAAIVMVLLRVTLSEMGLFQEEIEAWIEAEVGVAITFDNATAQLDGRFLQLAVEKVSIRGGEKDGINTTFGAGQLRLDLLSSLRKGEWVTSSLTLQRPVLLMAQDYFFQPSPQTEEAFKATPLFSLLQWLLKQPVLSIEEGTVHLYQKAGSGLQWRFRDIGVEWVNSGYRHQLSGEMILHGEEPSPIALEMEWFGELLSAGGWDGQIHLNSPALHFAQLMGGVENSWGGVAPGSGSVEIWGEWLSGTLEKGRGRLRRAAHFQQAPGLAGGEFFWDRQGSRSWRLQMEQLVWGGESEKDRESHPTSAQIELSQDRTGQDILLGAVDHVRLVPSPALSGLYATLIQGESGVLVAGDLFQLKFRSYPDDSGFFNQIEAKMNLDNISLQGVRQVAGYGVTGINGQLHLNEERGAFIPAAGTMSVLLDEYYSEPLSLALQGGVFSWARHPKALLLVLNGLKGEVGAVQFAGQGQLLMPTGGAPPVVTLDTTVKAQQISTLLQQLPESQLPPELVAWLKESFLSGALTEGRVQLQGPIDQFPFQQGEGTFVADLRVRDLYMHYAEAWPIISHSQARIHFNKDAMTAVLEEGKLDGHPIHNIEVSSESLLNGVLNIRGQLVSESPKLLRSLENTPLSGRVKQLNSVIAMEGYALLDLEVLVPMDGQPIKVDGRVELHDNKLSIKELGLDLGQVEGNVEFTDEGVTIEGIRGKMLGGPVHITAFSADNQNQSELVVGLDGALQGEALEQWLGFQSVDNPLFRAETDIEWNGRLKIQQDKLDLHLHSALQGVVLAAPEPFNKEGEQRWPTTLSMKVRSGGVEQLNLSIPDRLYAKLSKGEDSGEKKSPWRGRLLFGDKEQTLPAGKSPKGIELVGAVEEIDLNAWFDLLKSDRMVRKGEGERFTVGRLLLHADRAELFGQQLESMMLSVTRGQEGQYQLQVSSDQMKGSLLLQEDPQLPLVVDLDHLELGKAEPDESEVAGQEAEPTSINIEVDPSQFPAVELSSQKTRINGIDFGTLQLKTHPTKNGLFVDDATLESEVMRVSAQGSWMQREGQPISKFNIRVVGDELGKILSLFGYSGEIDRGDASIHIKAEWPDRPTGFSLNHMKGELEVSVEKGQLRDVDQGIGRVFGLLGIHTLVRRLTLDFSDITDEGFPFDAIHGTFSVENGDAHTRDLQIDGPSALIKVAGRTGIVERDYDQLVSVSPKISETLPATGAILAGPVGAAIGSVVLLYQKIFEKEGIATTRYTLTGKWDAPVLEEVRKVSAPVEELSLP
ncbi:MAG: TIGR02099 family protein [Gammaproteobacteria bacterium]|jgi:uncharacterized protein (TIGR02099 family)|nr:TIGR02099 family protein [Gammaproteobacteria bacterium]